MMFCDHDDDDDGDDDDDSSLSLSIAVDAFENSLVVRRTLFHPLISFPFSELAQSISILIKIDIIAHFQIHHEMDEMKAEAQAHQSLCSFMSQVFPSLIVSGFGMLAAGIMLDGVQV